MARIISTLYDDRIKAYNILLEMKVPEYIRIATKVLQNNEFQRVKIKYSQTVYSLLKQDLKEGCVIPPIVMATSDENFNFQKVEEITDEDIEKLLQKEDLLVLDGLQRTHILMELSDELNQKGDVDTLNRLNNRLLRVEYYIGLKRLAILYRMLTLNTGQTPMSLRHQIEILYLDYSKQAFEGIKLLRQVDEERATQIGEYSFQSVIEGFNSYLSRSELPIDRQDLLENIKGLDDLSIEGLDRQPDLFKDFITTYNKFVVKMDQVAFGWQFSRGYTELKFSNKEFGSNIRQIFSRSQALTGFGAAIGKLKGYSLIQNFEQIGQMITDLSFNDPNNLYKFLYYLDQISINSKKIGNSQRMYFQYFFRELFNIESDSYQQVDRAINNAYNKYLSQFT